MEALGRHILVDYTGCDPLKLQDQEFVTRAMLEAARASGATIVTHSFHHFHPGGVSGAVIISESHLAIHTWPEHRYAAVDLFTCGGNVDPWKAYECLKMAFNAEHGNAVEMQRGLRIAHHVQALEPDDRLV